MSDKQDDNQQPRIVWMEPVVEKRWRFQFRLIELFVVMTVACVVFAALGAFGVKGTLERMEVAGVVASPFLALFEFWIRWQKHTAE